MTPDLPEVELYEEDLGLSAATAIKFMKERRVDLVDEFDDEEEDLAD